MLSITLPPTTSIPAHETTALTPGQRVTYAIPTGDWCGFLVDDCTVIRTEGKQVTIKHANWTNSKTVERSSVYIVVPAGYDENAINAAEVARVKRLLSL